MASRWVERVSRNRFSLLVSIPRNRAEMARAAQEGGADAIKVHANCKHPASGFVFGSIAKEQKNFNKVLQSVSIPVGLVPGEAKLPSGQEMEEVHRMGFDFFDVFAHFMPLEYLKLPLGKMVCIDGRYSPEGVGALAASGAEVFEASVIPHEGYGKPVTLADLAYWRELCADLPVPLLVSTQRKIMPEACALLREVGVRGVVIGVVVTGETPQGVYETTLRFRTAIDSLDRLS